MPVYDYVCSSCHRLTEVVRGIEAEGPRFCPECGAEGTMIKVFSAPSVHFKGSGWAKKDRGTLARAAKAKDEKASSSGDGTTTEKASGSGDTSSADTRKSDSGSSGGSSKGASSPGESSSGGSSSSTGSSD